MGKGRRIETRKIPGEYDGEIGLRRLRLGWKESESLTVDFTIESNWFCLILGLFFESKLKI